MRVERFVLALPTRAQTLSSLQSQPRSALSSLSGRQQVKLSQRVAPILQSFSTHLLRAAEHTKCLIVRVAYQEPD